MMRFVAVAALLALATAQTLPTPTNAAKADSTLKVKGAAGKPTTLEFATGMDSADADKKGSYSFTNSGKGSMAMTAKFADAAKVSNPAAPGSAAVKARGSFTVAGRKQW